MSQGFKPLAVFRARAILLRVHLDIVYANLEVATHTRGKYK